ncbi:hypothetical protein SAMN06265365_1402 [Tistlia consotensis]|uniref:Imelysin-like domain-containing protein n=1 Tax=Tistlia consotensis USBA 355 TaxID=560819 RepID=A0A1Y6CXB6_9PROT|nr:imelysin family protein [Tistlia consotensis]SMF81376.1 hypothetical protein SAMN05428998_14336 [Tistlia consotensis USBA 355]SNS22680.1 hypothetical protein SAMN06265365_1402 [Tistlia consotensis]
MSRSLQTLRRLALPAALAAALLAGLQAARATEAPVSLAAVALGEADYQRVNDALVQHHVVPRYQVMAAAMAALDAAAGRYCAAPGAGTLAALRAADEAAVDAWMGVQHLHFGPVELFMRSYRLYFWPQGRGRIAQATGELLAAADPASLEEQHFRNASTAIQGLPALEVLLYGEGAEETPSAFRCALLTRIACNMKAMAADIVEEWQGGKIDFARTVAEPGPDNPYFESAEEATLAFFQSLYNGLELISDARLKPVAGASIEKAKPALAESRAPGRSLRNVVVNLEALQGLYEGEGGPGLGDLAVRSGADPKLEPLLRKAFRLTVETAKGIEPPLAEAVVDPKRRKAVDKLLTQLVAIKQILRSRFSPATGLPIGFNAMDGD